MNYLRKEHSTIPALHPDGKYEFDKANMLNNYFSTCFNTSLPPLSGSYETAEHLELLEGTHESLLCKEEYVIDLLQNIDVSKASGQDQISGRRPLPTGLRWLKKEMKLVPCFSTFGKHLTQFLTMPC